MDFSRRAHLRFFVTLVVALAVAVVLASIINRSPDPYSMALVVGPFLLLAVVISAWLSYRDGSVESSRT